MADLSHLPLRLEPERSNLDLTLYPTQGAELVPAGRYIATLVPRPNKKRPVRFDKNGKGFLRASFVIRLEGRLKIDSSGAQSLTDDYAGTLLSCRASASPSRYGYSLRRMLRALGSTSSLQTDQDYKQAVLACIRRLAVVHISHHGYCRLDDGSYRDYWASEFHGPSLLVYSETGDPVSGQTDTTRKTREVSAREVISRWSAWQPQIQKGPDPI